MRNKAEKLGPRTRKHFWAKLFFNLFLLRMKTKKTIPPTQSTKRTTCSLDIDDSSIRASNLVFTKFKCKPRGHLWQRDEITIQPDDRTLIWGLENVQSEPNLSRSKETFEVQISHRFVIKYAINGKESSERNPKFHWSLVLQPSGLFMTAGRLHMLQV